MKHNPIFSLKIYVQLFIFSIIATSLSGQAIVVDVEIDNGLAEYDIIGAEDDAHIFTIFGDGSFSSSSSPEHQFEDSDLGYSSKVFVLDRYDPILPPAITYDIPPISVIEDDVYFVNPEIHFEGEIDVLTSWATSAGYENYFILAFENTSSYTPVDGNISFHYNEMNLTINETDLLEYDWVNSRTIIDSDWGSPSVDRMLHWSFSDLEYGEKRFVYIPAVVNLSSGSELITKAKYSTTNTRKIISKESQKEFLVRRFPHDPNFKIVNKTCLKPIDAAQKLEYTIGFFNDGNAFANDVFIFDNLPVKLDPSTVSIIDSEYPLTSSIAGSLLSIVFTGIQLPGTNQVVPMTYSYDQASSYVTFGICTVPNLSFGSEISNEAAIIFDTQAPFITDPSILYAEQSCLYADFCSSSSSIIHNTQESVHDYTLATYPNPVSENLNIQLNIDVLEKSNVTYVIHDTMGKIVTTKQSVLYKGDIFKHVINVSNLDSGIYILTITSGTQVYSSKFIKQ